MIYLEKMDIDAASFPVQDQHPFDLGIYQNTDQLVFKNDITFFIGENGTGKSTMLRAMAHCCGIHIWQKESLSRIAANPHEETLYRHLRPTWTNGPVPGSFFGSQIFSDFARNLEQWAAMDENLLEYFGGKSLLAQSHGQSLMSFFSSRYGRKGIYFLDEPETALSPKSLIRLLNLLIAVREKGHAQFIIATHSPFLLACPGADILSFDQETIGPVSYQDTSYYNLYKAFMENPGQFIKI